MVKKSSSIQAIKKAILPILKKHRVSKAGIFGSYARGEQKKNSDLDILVKLDKQLSLFDLVEIKLELEDQVKRKVDLVEYQALHPLIKHRVLQEEVKVL